MVLDGIFPAGVSIQVRAAKTEADTSTWTGSNPICATVNLTTDNLGKMIKCSQTLLARYVTVIGTNLGGDGLPVCSLDAIVTMPVPPNEAAPPSPVASGTARPPISMYYCSLIPIYDVGQIACRHVLVASLPC